MLEIQQQIPRTTKGKYLGHSSHLKIALDFCVFYSTPIILCNTINITIHVTLRGV